MAWPTKARPSSSTSAAYFLNAPLPPNDDHLVGPVLFGDADLDLLAVRRRHVLADVVGPDRQLAMPAVDQHRQLDGARAAELDQSVHGGARCAAPVDHVVHQHDDLAVDVGHVRGEVPRGLAEVVVVAMLADI